MKMEVLSVQNQYQGQYGVIGSTKNKDWTSPLTPPPPPPATHGHSQQQRSSNHQQQQQSNSKNIQDSNDSVDVVDGRPTKPNHYYRNQHAHQQQHQQQQQLNQATMEAAATAAVEGNSSARYAYNNNLLCCEPLPLPELSATPFGAPNNDIDAAAINELSQRLQAELRAAKTRHLECTEVSVPWDLTPRIASEILKTSEREPCGIRGCTIYIEFEDEPNNTRRIASFKVDPNTMPTFELYLTLKHDKSGWTSLLPQFLKNLTRSNTILISPDFTLTKNKLYSCE